jgi:hypothetical protein
MRGLPSLFLLANSLALLPRLIMQSRFRVIVENVESKSLRAFVAVEASPSSRDHVGRIALSRMSASLLAFSNRVEADVISIKINTSATEESFRFVWLDSFDREYLHD